MDTLNLISITIGITGIAVGTYFGIQQNKAKEIMRVFVTSLQNQSQSACKSLENIIHKENASLDWVKGKIESIYDSLAALNGSIITFYDEFYKK